MTPSWADLWYRLRWLAYDRYRDMQKAWRHWRVGRLQARRVTAPFTYEVGSPIPILASANYPRWGGNQMYFEASVRTAATAVSPPAPFLTIQEMSDVYRKSMNREPTASDTWLVPEHHGADRLAKSRAGFVFRNE